jgi:hypothetical protein
MEVHENVEEDYQALEQDESLKCFRREAFCSLRPFLWSFDET